MAGTHGTEDLIAKQVGIIVANGDLATAYDSCTASGGSAIFYSFEGSSIIHQEKHQEVGVVAVS